MKSYLGRSLEGPHVQALLSLWRWGAPPSWHMDVFTNLEALHTPEFRDLLWRFHHVGVID